MTDSLTYVDVREVNLEDLEGFVEPTTINPFDLLEDLYFGLPDTFTVPRASGQGVHVIAKPTLPSRQQGDHPLRINGSTYDTLRGMQAHRLVPYLRNMHSYGAAMYLMLCRYGSELDSLRSMRSGHENQPTIQVRHSSQRGSRTYIQPMEGDDSSGGLGGYNCGRL